MQHWPHGGSAGGCGHRSLGAAVHCQRGGSGGFRAGHRADQRLERMVRGMVPGRRGAREARAAGARRRQGNVRRRAPGPGRRLLPLREVPVRPGHGAAAGGARRGCPVPDRRAAVPAPAGRAGGDPVRRRRAGRPCCGARRRRARTRYRDPDLRARLGQGGAPRYRGSCSWTGAWPRSPSTGPGQGEAEYDVGDQAGLGSPRPASIIDAVGRAARPGSGPGSGSGASAWAATTRARMASGDRRVRACVTLSGPFSFGAAWDQLPDLSRDAFRGPVEGGDGEGGQAARRRADHGRPGRALTCPLLIVAGQQDRIVPWPPGQAARRRGRAARPSCCCSPTATTAARTCRTSTGPTRADWMARQLARR